MSSQPLYAIDVMWVTRWENFWSCLPTHVRMGSSIAIGRCDHTAAFFRLSLRSTIRALSKQKPCYQAGTDFEERDGRERMGSLRGSVTANWR